MVFEVQQTSIRSPRLLIHYVTLDKLMNLSERVSFSIIWRQQAPPRRLLWERNEAATPAELEDPHLHCYADWHFVSSRRVTGDGQGPSWPAESPRCQAQSLSSWLGNAWANNLRPPKVCAPAIPPSAHVSNVTLSPPARHCPMTVTVRECCLIRSRRAGNNTLKVLFVWTMDQSTVPGARHQVCIYGMAPLAWFLTHLLETLPLPRLSSPSSPALFFSIKFLFIIPV